MTTVCFVTNELAPYTWGGCGTLLRHLAEELLAKGTAVVFLLDVPAAAFAAFDAKSFVRPELVTAQHVEALCADMAQDRPGEGWRLVARARRCHYALSRLAAQTPLDCIEFADYFGTALFALAARIARGTYGQSRLVVRMHGLISSILSLEPHAPGDEEKPLLWGMERQAAALAETVLVNTPHYFASPGVGAFPLLSGEPVVSPAPPPPPGPGREAASDADADTILFFGRLHGFKGVDVLLDAALALLRRRPDWPARFVFAGHDAERDPAGRGSCRDWLRSRIPQGLAERFSFPGTMGPDALAALLPRVRFAVFPSRLESFGYAANELRAAGVPLLVSDIPAFRDAFVDEESALFCSGTAAGLASQMARLWDDTALRRRLARARPQRPADGRDVYLRPQALPRWIKAPDAACRALAPLVVVLADGSGRERDTVRAVREQGVDASRIVVLVPDALGRGAFFFLDRLVRACAADGGPWAGGEPLTADALLLLRAGDLPRGDLLPVCLGVLARQPEIAFVATFAEVVDADGGHPDCFPLDAGLEFAPFCGRPALSRAVLRTVPGVALSDLFEPQLMAGGEFALLLDLVAAGGHGITIPECLVQRPAGDEPGVPVQALAVLCDRHGSGRGGLGPALLRGALWSREDVAAQAAAAARQLAQGEEWAGRLEARLGDAQRAAQDARDRAAALAAEGERLRAALEDGARREERLRERQEQILGTLETARAEHAALAARLAALEPLQEACASLRRECSDLRRERDAAVAHGEGLAARLDAVEHSLTWKCGIRLALSPPGRLLKRLLDALGKK
jgi:glycosyltransferase involved in cell wall biosynthesis